MKVRELSVAEARLVARVAPDQPRGALCDGTAPGRVRGGLWICSREAGHRGAHVAHGRWGPLALWDDEADS